MQLDIERLIEDFGGPGRLAEALARAFPEEPISRAAIYKWRERGSLPLMQLNKLAQLAANQGRKFDYSDYLASTTTASAPGRNHKMGDRLFIFDTTLRDGEQSPGAAMTRDEKLRIARQLERLGVDIIEAGFAAASPGDAQAIRAIAEVVKDSTVCSLARTQERDVRAAGEAIRPAQRGRIHTFIATSPIHMEKKLRMPLLGSTLLPLDDTSLITLHWLHRLGALVLSLALWIFVWRGWQVPPLRRSLLCLGLAWCVQVSLGVANVLLQLPLALAVLHNLGALLLLSLTWLLLHRVRRKSSCD